MLVTAVFSQQLLSEYCVNLLHNVFELCSYCRHFQATDTKKFHDIWCMNEEEVKELAQKVLEQDKIITEQQLGMQWKPPQDL